jgi:hypothetical protein
MTVDGSRLQQLWAAAGARPAASAFRTVRVGVQCAHGPVLVGVDRADRHALLVPVGSKQTLTEQVDGRAVVLRRRTLEDEEHYRTYACLELADGELEEVFTALCVEVIERIASRPDKAVRALTQVLSDWRNLLANARETLSSAALAGLFGELTVLRELLRADSGAVAFWTGPTGAAQDFHRGADAVEVKTTVSPEGRSVRISGIDQLEVPGAGRLVLRFFRLRTDRGMSLPALVDEVLELVDDVPGFHKLLLEYGYRESERELYGRRAFEIVEDRGYEVTPGFPRIISSGLRGDAAVAGVGEIEYTVDLDSSPAAEALMDDEALRRFMEGS